MSDIPIVWDLSSPCGGGHELAELPAGFLVTPARAALAELERRIAARPVGAEPPQVAALVPDLSEYVRDASDHGLAGAAVLRLRRGGPSALGRVARVGLGAARGIAGRDFAAVLQVLLELELAAVRRFRPRRAFLSAGITDLALAARNRRLLDAYARHVRRRHRAEPWLESRNPGHLLRALREWGSEVRGVLIPLNPRGLGMKPDLRTTLDELGRVRVEVWARDVTAGGSVPAAEGIQFAAARGATAAVLAAGEVRSHFEGRAGVA